MELLKAAMVLLFVALSVIADNSTDSAIFLIGAGIMWSNNTKGD